MQHRLVVLGVVGFWAVMMGSLVRHWLLEVKPELVPGTYRSVLTPERENYQTRMGIYVPGEAGLQRVGFTETVFFYDEDRYSIQNTTRVRMPVHGLLRALSAFDLTSTAVIGKGHQLERLAVLLSSAMGRAECHGRVVDGKLVLAIKLGDQEDVREVPLPPGGIVASSLSPLVALPPLRVGMRWSVAILDPLTLAPRRLELEVLRREGIEWEGRHWDTHVVEIRADVLKAQAWISRDGEVLKERALFGLTFIKERPPEEELDELRTEPTPQAATTQEGAGK